MTGPRLQSDSHASHPLSGEEGPRPPATSISKFRNIISTGMALRTRPREHGMKNTPSSVPEPTCRRTATTSTSRTHLRYISVQTHYVRETHAKTARCTAYVYDWCSPALCNPQFKEQSSARLSGFCMPPDSRSLARPLPVGHGIPSRAAHLRTCRRPDV
jgi:hypothetical protein